MEVKSLVPVKNQTISNEYHPPQDLQRFVQVLLSEEVAGNKTEAERITGVQKEKFYYHLKRYPDFKEWVNEQRQEHRVRNAPLVDAQLIAAVKKGDVAAMKLWYMLGEELKTPSMQLNQQFNLGNFDVNKKYPKCCGCPNEERQKHNFAVHHTAGQIETILDAHIKDEELNDFNVGAIISMIRRRPFWFRRVLEAALKVAFAKEEGEYSGPEVPCPGWPNFLPCKRENCSMREPY